ncbi:esterase/lipase family protein [Nocardioides speluncae]|uniref:esterase/lipase family protein n=1 Tax=Nocardioides speluncae TaxID=2670337 RepID=UPI000D693A24|nr:alpha/beta fold hydrolase [Nocardioides speluncae]
MLKRFALPAAVLAAILGTAAPGATATTAPAPAAPAAVAAAPEVDPVIVVAGFGSPAIGAWPLAKRIGFATGAETYTSVGSRYSGLGSIVDGAKDLAVLVDNVLEETGASQVDLVGISMGGLTARQYIKFEGGDGKVDRIATVVTPNYGTNRASLAEYLDCVGIAPCKQMAIGSDFLKALNGDDDTYGSATYATFRTNWDEVVVPIDSVKLNSGATNVFYQDHCPFRFTEHLLAALDGAMADGVIDFLKGQEIKLNCWAF